jgi:dipeptidyl aminopeptidase/acylaminoacyl peptidase
MCGYCKTHLQNRWLLADDIFRQHPFEWVTLPDAGHGWDAEGNDQRRFAFTKMVEFFDRHLKPGGE